MKRSHFLGLSALVLSTAALMAPAQLLPNQPDPIDGILPCIGCVVTGQLNRERSFEDSTCRSMYGDDAPRLIYTGRCVRYQCLTGYFYAFDGWYPTSTCTAEVLNDPDVCPHGSCIPLPFITMIPDDGQQCSVSRLPSSGTMTREYASELVKAGLPTNGQK